MTVTDRLYACSLAVRRGRVVTEDDQHHLYAVTSVSHLRISHYYAYRYTLSLPYLPHTGPDYGMGKLQGHPHFLFHSDSSHRYPKHTNVVGCYYVHFWWTIYFKDDCYLISILTYGGLRYTLGCPGGSICLNPALCKHRTYRIAIHLSHYSDRETELTISEKFDRLLSIFTCINYTAGKVRWSPTETWKEILLKIQKN